MDVIFASLILMQKAVMKKITSTLLLVTIIFMSACSPKSTDDSSVIDEKVDSVLKLMTLEEKIGQLVLYTSDWDVTGPARLSV